ncbi:MAG: imidazole glycerol phosphate synthase subunit HisH [Prevotella sp.]|nr:imidazole glycerol phosphate synthase subunit HisH [Prevotella sp.]
MQVAIVKYNAGNIYSVVNALHRLGVEPLLTDDAEALRRADRVIFPGQGEARGAMDYLRARGLDEVIRSLTQPVLGICIGQQLLCRHSEEGDTQCIGIFDVDVKRFQPTRHEDKVPCMGWNKLSLPPTPPKGRGFENVLFRGLFDTKPSSPGEEMEVGQPYVYFVHSYYVPLCEHTIATADYVQPYSAALHKDNFYTCQFHPEKSGAVGECIIKNFLEL